MGIVLTCSIVNKINWRIVPVARIIDYHFHSLFPRGVRGHALKCRDKTIRQSSDALYPVFFFCLEKA